MSEEGKPLVGSHDTSDNSSHLCGRRISLWLARIFPKYGAHASLSESWNYFENITLPRREPDGEGDFTKAPPGTHPSTLYPAWTTPQRELNDFGTGILNYIL